MNKPMITLMIAAICALAVILPSAAQPTSTPDAPVTGPAAVPFAALTPAPTVQPAEDDGRLTVCSAPTRPDFRPYLVRAGDALIDLLVGHSAFTPAQIAALNCLPDPDDLPFGAVIWLPDDAFAVVDGGAIVGAVAVSVGEDATPEAEADADEPEIRAFTPPPASITHDQTFTITWDASGDHAFAYLCVLDQADPADCHHPRLSARLPVSGELEIGPFAAAGLYQVVVEIWDAQGRATSASQPFVVTCAQVSLAGELAGRRCPDDPPRTVFAAHQSFSGGQMIYFSDVGQIYVLTDDQRFSVYEDVYIEGMPDPAVAAPSGLITPVRGFGQVWLTLGGTEAAIGFGLAHEQGYDAQRQPAARGSFTTYVTTPDGTLALTSVPGQPGGWWVWVN